MHQPRWQYPFRAHALVHHGIFRSGPKYFLSAHEDFGKIRFAWWQGPVILILHAPVIVWIQHTLEFEIFFGALSSLGLYYSLYEYLHFCMHVPKGRWFEKSAWFDWLDSHHHMHHERQLINLNVVLPLADAVLGTLVPAKKRMAVPDRRRGALQVEAILQ